MALCDGRSRIRFAGVTVYSGGDLMGLWTGIKAAGSWLMGGGDNAGLEVVKGVGGWIDGQEFTDQEKAEDALKRAERYGQYLSQTMQENSERSRTRRALALLVIRWWLVILTASAALYKVDQAWSVYLFKIATFEGVAALVLAIGAFFFGAHLVRGVKEK